MSEIDQNSFLTGTNSAFISELYARWQEDPGAVDPSWRGFFAELADAPDAVQKELDGPAWGPGRGPGLLNGHETAAANGHAAVAALPEDARQAALDAIRVMNLIRAYRVNGHLIATLDPLGLNRRTEHPDLDPATYGFTAADLDRPFFVNNILGFTTATLRQIIEALRATYSGNVGVEYMHIQALEQRQWIQARIEVPRNHTEFTAEGKRAILERLTAAE